MSSESFQEALFEDPIGQRFRNAREKAQLSLESVSRQLKLPVAVIEAIEKEDWTRLGAPIYVQSHAGSYARLLGLPAELVDEIARSKPTPQLVTVGVGSPVRRMIDHSVMKLAYLAMTVVIAGSVVMLAMHFQTPPIIAQVLPLDPPSTMPESRTAATPLASGTATHNAPAAAAIATTTNSSTPVNPSPADAPVMASLAPSLPVAAVAQSSGVLLSFRGESWAEILDSAGQRVERGLIAAGTERRFATGQVARVTLGNADAVDVTVDGQPLDLAAYSNANVAHFTVSSDGRIAPAGN